MVENFVVNTSVFMTLLLQVEIFFSHTKNIAKITPSSLSFNECYVKIQ